MSFGSIFAIAAVVFVIFVVGAWYIGTMNRFRYLDVKIDEALSGIDVALTKRFDSLSKMWSLAKKYMEHEKGTLENVIKMRNQGANTIQEKQALNNEMGKLMSGFNVVFEQYPELKADRSIAETQAAVMDIEEHLQAARRLYNSNVSLYNQLKVMFPTSIVGNMIHAEEKEFFEAEDRKREDVVFE